MEISMDLPCPIRLLVRGGWWTPRERWVVVVVVVEVY